MCEYWPVRMVARLGVQIELVAKTFVSQAIQVRRLIHARPVGADRVRSVVVRHDIDDVGAFVGERQRQVTSSLHLRLDGSIRRLGEFRDSLAARRPDRLLAVHTRMEHDVRGLPVLPGDVHAHGAAGLQARHAAVRQG